MTARLAFAALVALAIALLSWGAMDAAARYIAATLPPAPDGLERPEQPETTTLEETP